MTWTIAYSLIAAAAGGVTLAVTPICRRLAWRTDFLDKPLGEHHKQHDEATPLLGGLAMAVSWLVTIWVGIALALSETAAQTGIAADLPGIRSVLIGLGVISGGACGVTLLGLVDDRRPMGPLLKFILQATVCGLVALYPKLRITLFWQSDVLTWMFTVAWFLLVLNAFNFFDNMDGLAAGIALIAAALFTLVAGLQEQHFVAALGAATSGTALGFYVYNRHPASIFMGDAGSHFLGFLLAVMGALTLFYQEGSSPTPAPVLIPVFILALPIFDAFAVVVIRLHAGKPIYAGDHNHISHRFHRLGVSRKTAVLLVHLLALAIGLGAFPLLWLDLRGVILVLIQATAMLALVTIVQIAPDAGGSGAEEEADDV
jgi:UDP-GlcNAc:undecaprenyl-phosphate GlcNAc-1-phosphate transferase